MPDRQSLISQLRNNPFFKAVDEQTLSDLAREAMRHEYSAGEVVFLDGEASRGLYDLQSGCRM
ncbi:MAG TPA: hypothetical protein VI793_07720 [Anaerolineales bacterium]|nr:hypothetical protein [Anaerolineales bacterium]